MTNYRWSNRKIREQVSVIDQKINPTVVLFNATYLNSYLYEWDNANIWIYEDRIVYIGPDLPLMNETFELVDCTNFYLVPGYIEPHAHPFQIYNPVNYANYSAKYGTTTLISDNMAFVFDLPNEDAFTLLDKLSDLPTTYYWWSRLDSQSELPINETLFTTENMLPWLKNEHVLQAGELTAWPKLLAGDDNMLTWIQETKKLRKRVEGHFPGASISTLTKLMLLGAESDHEAMTGEEVINRLRLGYMVTLRQSSIRPDLDLLLDELLASNIKNYSKLMLTTDGSHPYFYENGLTDQLIKKVISKGMDEITAYHMATHHVATYYGIDNLVGSIAVGRIANINFLTDKDNPTPVKVLAKGEWITNTTPYTFNWEQNFYEPLQLSWDLEDKHLNVFSEIGMELLNSVIAKPYKVEEENPMRLYMLDIHGKWTVSTSVLGFANELGGFISSYSGTGDILLLGNKNEDMKLAFKRMKEIKGGIVIVEKGEILFELPLELKGRMSNRPMEELIEKNKELNILMKKKGFNHSDILFTLLFFSATHLPFIRITPTGVVDVKARKILIEPISIN